MQIKIYNSMLQYLGRSMFKKAKKEVFCLVSNSAFIKIKFFKDMLVKIKIIFFSLETWFTKLFHFNVKVVFNEIKIAAYCTHWLGISKFFFFFQTRNTFSNNSTSVMSYLMQTKTFVTSRTLPQIKIILKWVYCIKLADIL